VVSRFSGCFTVSRITRRQILSACFSLAVSAVIVGCLFHCSAPSPPPPTDAGKQVLLGDALNSFFLTQFIGHMNTPELFFLFLNFGGGGERFMSFHTRTCNSRACSTVARLYSESTCGLLNACSFFPPSSQPSHLWREKGKIPLNLLSYLLT
jgi:hypothetical protein